MRSGDDHCDQALADDVRRRSLQSRAGRWGPARKARRRRRRRRTSARSRASDIKSNNLHPHLAGGEKEFAIVLAPSPNPVIPCHAKLSKSWCFENWFWFKSSSPCKHQRFSFWHVAPSVCAYEAWNARWCPAEIRPDVNMSSDSCGDPGSPFKLQQTQMVSLDWLDIILTSARSAAALLTAQKQATESQDGLLPQLSRPSMWPLPPSIPQHQDP